jgi:thiol:disulfide interchange protein
MNASWLRGSATLVMLAGCSVVAQIQLSGVARKGTPVDPVALEFVRIDTTVPRMFSVEIRLSMPPDVHIYAAESLFFAVAQTQVRGLGTGIVELPARSPYRNVDGTIVDIYKHGQVIHIHKPIESEAWAIAGYVQYQACNGKMCFLPQKREFRFASAGGTVAGGVATAVSTPSAVGEEEWRMFADSLRVAGTAGGFLPVDKLLSFLNSPSAPSGQGVDAFAGKSLWLVVLLILIGGLLLNLTPCVLPMLPITIAVLGAGANARSRAHGFLVGGVYGLAMALAYGVVGLVVVITGTTFGSLNSSWLFNLGIAIVFMVLGLAMFDIVHIDFTRFRSGMPKAGANRSGSSLVTVFSMGVIAALLAGACVAPVVISVILYAATLCAKGHVAGLLLPFLLGVGMAIPWPFAGAGLSFLPKPGGWMTWVRNGFGVIILVIALYYGYMGVKLVMESQAPQSTAVTETSQDATLVWQPSLAQGLARAQAEGKPVFVDFWASWCKNCHAMDATTMRDPGVVKKLSEFVLVRYQADRPAEEPAKSVLAYFKVVGLPTYVVLEGKRK